MKMRKRTPILGLLVPHVVLALMCPGTLLGSCAAVSIQSRRRINHGYRRLKSCAKFRPDSPKSFRSRVPGASHNSFSMHPASLLVRGPTLFGLKTVLEVDIHVDNSTPRHLMLRSLAFVATCRRLTFLILSVSFVNFFRSTILEASSYAALLMSRQQ